MTFVDPDAVDGSDPNSGDDDDERDELGTTVRKNGGRRSTGKESEESCDPEPRVRHPESRGHRLVRRNGPRHRTHVPGRRLRLCDRPPLGSSSGNGGGPFVPAPTPLSVDFWRLKSIYSRICVLMERLFSACYVHRLPCDLPSVSR